MKLATFRHVNDTTTQQIGYISTRYRDWSISFWECKNKNKSEIVRDDIVCDIIITLNSWKI